MFKGNSITQTTWFWPLLSICLALLLSIPCTLITVVIFCYKKKNSDNDDDDDSDESSTSSRSSSSSLSIRAQRRSMHHHNHHHHHRSRPHCSHYAGALHSPPPPYTTSERPENVFVTPSLPPPYETRLIENVSRPTTTVINVEPIESNENHSSIDQRLETTLDISSTLTSPSIQTFQV